MKYLVISGIDGSGKTTLIDKIREQFLNKGIFSLYIWLRFNHYFCKIMHGFARFLGLSVKRPSYRGHIWFHEFYRSKLFCAVYIRMTYLDTIIGCLKLRFLLYKNSTSEYVICDRWVPDILVDLGVKTHNDTFLDTVWYDRFMSLMPADKQIFLIARDTSKVLNSRKENCEDPDFHLRNRLYIKLQQKNGIRVINNNIPINQSVKELLDIILYETA